MRQLLSHIATQTGLTIISCQSVSGGDISTAYKLTSTSKDYFFLKVNSKPFAEKMFLAEKIGLEAIAATRTIAVPNVLLTGTLEGKSFLLMEFITNKRASSQAHALLGEQLAKMHSIPQSTFGFPSDNFIGNLPQRNHSHDKWDEFYWDERIFPQLKMASDNQLLPFSKIPDKEKAVAVFAEIFGDVKPSLLHGDLWGGNYLISENGTPYLIDPAVYFGHSMVDIAMSRLFGGFSSDFYNAYHHIIPTHENYEAQIELYQLYYLIVHLNMFGDSYYSRVNSILSRYF